MEELLTVDQTGPRDPVNRERQARADVQQCLRGGKRVGVRQACQFCRAYPVERDPSSPPLSYPLLGKRGVIVHAFIMADRVGRFAASYASPEPRI